MQDEREAREQIGQTERAAEEHERAARLFDIRRLIGGLFLLYGLMLFVAGLMASDADIAKAVDVNINLWLGLAMIAFGGLMAGWSFYRPVTVDREAAAEAEAGR
jgi:cation transport ATPase